MTYIVSSEMKNLDPFNQLVVCKSVCDDGRETHYEQAETLYYAYYFVNVSRIKMVES